MVMSCVETSIPKYLRLEVEVNGKMKKGRPRKLWEECVKEDLERFGLRREAAYDRMKW